MPVLTAVLVISVAISLYFSFVFVAAGVGNITSATNLVNSLILKVRIGSCLVEIWYSASKCDQ